MENPTNPQQPAFMPRHTCEHHFEPSIQTTTTNSNGKEEISVKMLVLEYFCVRCGQFVVPDKRNGSF